MTRWPRRLRGNMAGFRFSISGTRPRVRFLMLRYSRLCPEDSDIYLEGRGVREKRNFKTFASGSNARYLLTSDDLMPAGMSPGA